MFASFVSMRCYGFVSAIAAAVLIVVSSMTTAQAKQNSELKRHYSTSMGTSVSAEIEIEIAPEYYRNLDLRRAQDDAVSFTRYKLTPSFLFKPTDHVDVHLEFRVDAKQVHRDPESYESEFTRLKLREAYLLYEPSEVGSVIFQVGRRRFRDDREWLVDEHLDALRVRWGSGPFELDVSASSELIDSDESIVNLMGFAKYLADWGSAELFAIDRRDKDARAHPVWVGMRLRAHPRERLSLHADGAMRRGRDGAMRLRGYGVDAGATWILGGSSRPSLTLAYAHGSGDSNPHDRTDYTFRQTGMEDNNGRIAGVDTFQYYGIVSAPELSNLGIATIGFGVRPVDKASIELVWHGYRRHAHAARIRTALESNPAGRSRDIGQELNLLVAYRAKTWRANLALGWFSPGKAFRRADGVFGATGEIRMRF